MAVNDWLQYCSINTVFYMPYKMWWQLQANRMCLPLIHWVQFASNIREAHCGLRQSQSLWKTGVCGWTPSSRLIVYLPFENSSKMCGMTSSGHRSSLRLHSLDHYHIKIQDILLLVNWILTIIVYWILYIGLERFTVSFNSVFILIGHQCAALPSLEQQKETRKSPSMEGKKVTCIYFNIRILHIQTVAWCTFTSQGIQPLRHSFHRQVHLTRKGKRVWQRFTTDATDSQPVCSCECWAPRTSKRGAWHVSTHTIQPVLAYIPKLQT